MINMWVSFGRFVHENVYGVEMVRECAAAGRAEIGLTRMIPQTRDAWLTRDIPNLWFSLPFYFLRETGRDS